MTTNELKACLVAANAIGHIQGMFQRALAKNDIAMAKIHLEALIKSLSLYEDYDTFKTWKNQYQNQLDKLYE